MKSTSFALRISVAVTLLQAASGQLAVGQENQTSRAAEGRSLEEVVVTAQKRAQNLQDVPVSVAVLNADDLAAAEVSSVVDLVQISPALNYQTRPSFAGNANFSMRGVGAFAPQPGIQPAIGVIVDDVPLARQGEFDADLSDIANVQVLTGPQGTLFGSSTTGGVLIVTTKQPTETFEGYAEASVTSDDEYTVRGAVSGPLAARVRARASAFKKELDGFIDNLYPGAPDIGGDEGQGGRVRFDIDLADDVSLSLSGDYSETEFSQSSQVSVADGPLILTALGNGDAALGQRVVDDPRLTNTDQTAVQSVELWGVSANLTWTLNDAFTLKSISSYRSADIEANGTLDEGTPGSRSNPYGLPRVSARRSNVALNSMSDPLFIGEVDYFTQELRLERSGSELEWLVGAFYNRNDELLLGEVPLFTGPAYNFFAQPRRGEVAVRSYSGFGDLTWHISDTVDVFGGLRWTHERLTNDHLRLTYIVPNGSYTQTDGNVFVNPGVAPVSVVAFSAKTSNEEWSGRGGVMWKFSPDANVYASASRGFTGGSADTSQLATPTNAFLFPSIAVSYEIGAKTSFFDRRLILNSAIFTITVDDLQAVRGLTNGTGVMTFNAGSMRSQGLEANLTALLGERFTLSAAVALLDTEMRGGLIQPCYRGQSAAQGCVDLTGDGNPEQNVDGKPVLNAPDLKFNLTGRYDVPLGPFDGRISVSYTWQDEISYELTYDPVASVEPSFGLLDVALGIVSPQGRYELSLFGKNVLDEEFAAQRAPQAAGLGRVGSLYTRGAQAYWGVRAKMNF